MGFLFEQGDGSCSVANGLYYLWDALGLASLFGPGLYNNTLYTQFCHNYYLIWSRADLLICINCSIYRLLLMIYWPITSFWRVEYMIRVSYIGLYPLYNRIIWYSIFRTLFLFDVTDEASFTVAVCFVFFFLLIISCAHVWYFSLVLMFYSIYTCQLLLTVAFVLMLYGLFFIQFCRWPPAY